MKRVCVRAAEVQIRAKNHPGQETQALDCISLGIRVTQILSQIMAIMCSANELEVFVN